MLTLSSEFEEAFKAGSVEPVLLVELWTGTADADARAFCTGSRILEFSGGLFNPFSSSNTGAKTAAPSVAAVSPLSIAIDPFERNVSRSTLTVTFHDDGALRALVAGVQLINQSITVKLGTHEITSSNNWAPVFRGFIEEINPREGQIDLVCRDMFQYLVQDYYGSYVNDHPLEAIKKILEDCNIPAALVDTTTFDPTESTYSDIAHFVVSYEAKFNGEQAAMPGGWFQLERSQIEPIETLRRCQDLARGMVGSLFNDEAGVLKFKRFHLATASVAAHFTADDIGNFEQLETIIVNEIDLSVSSHWIFGWGADTAKVKIQDSISQTAYSFPGLSDGIFNRPIELALEDLRAKLGSGLSVAGGLGLLAYTPYGLAGTRITGSYSPGDSWNSLQTSGTELSAARPGYFLIDDEVMKAESGTFNDGYYQIAFVRDAAGDITGEIKVPKSFTFTVPTAGRGVLGTTESSHHSIGGVFDPTASPIVDLTMGEYFAQTQLTRFSNGCPQLSITTDVGKWALQIGDFVTLESDVFLMFGEDGLDSLTRWEIVGKELQLDDGGALISWQLAYATKTSPPTTAFVFSWGDLPKPPGGKDIKDYEAGISRHVITGLEVAIDSGLNVTIGVGSGAYGGQSSSLSAALTAAMAATKDNYIDYSISDSTIGVIFETIGSQEPPLGVGHVRLAKVVTGGSTITSVDDLRQFGAVKARNISGLDFEGGANLLFNPDFEQWTRGNLSPPDAWKAASGTVWSTDATQENQETNTGRYSLKIGSDNKTVQSELIKVEPDRIYDFGGSVKASAAGLTVQVGIEWLDSSKSLLSTSYCVNQSGVAAWTKRNEAIAAPSTAEFARASLTRGAVSGASEAYFDSLRLVRSQTSFRARKTVAQSTVADKAGAPVEFDTEDHDLGDHFSSSGGSPTYAFTAKFDGTYEFEARIQSTLTSPQTDLGSFVELQKNLATLTRGGYSHETDSSTETMNFSVSSGPVRLAAGDVVRVTLYNYTGETLTIVNDGDYTWFSGRQVS